MVKTRSLLENPVQIEKDLYVCIIFMYTVYVYLQEVANVIIEQACLWRTKSEGIVEEERGRERKTWLGWELWIYCLPKSGEEETGESPPAPSLHTKQVCREVFSWTIYIICIHNVCIYIYIYICVCILWIWMSWSWLWLCPWYMHV